MSLRDQVESLLPSWESWYPSVFDAAVDLGLIRARVCSPGSLMLSQRHASVYNEALQAFREQWSVVEPEGEDEAQRDSRIQIRDSLEQASEANLRSDESRISNPESRPHR